MLISQGVPALGDHGLESLVRVGVGVRVGLGLGLGLEEVVGGAKEQQINPDDVTFPPPTWHVVSDNLSAWV